MENLTNPTFIRFLRAVQADFAFKWGGTRHLVGILNRMIGSSWQSWFERFICGYETPKL